jgi:signal transduction histidine kinase
VAHSGAEHLDISLHARDGMATLVVRDDGQGFSPEQALARQEEGHFGLRLLSDRVHDEGGELSIDSKPGEGTRVCAEVPLT